MTGWEEIKVRFYVKPHRKVDDDELSWYLVVKDVDKKDSGGTVCQWWDHEPTPEEIESATFAVKQGIQFMTLHLAVERRRVEVYMPKIRVRVVDEGGKELS